MVNEFSFGKSFAVSVRYTQGVYFAIASSYNIIGYSFIFYLRSSSLTPQEFDHIYPGTESHDTVIIVYADFTNDDFKAVHQKVVQLAAEHKFKYILRHSYQVN